MSTLIRSKPGVFFVIIVGSVLLSTTRFVASTNAADASAKTAAEDAPRKPDVKAARKGGDEKSDPVPPVVRSQTIAGVVRDASTKEPIAGIRVFINGSTTRTDKDGHYRREAASLVYILTDDDHPYVGALRRFTDAPQGGEIVADFDLPRGVVVTGRVLETGTDRPIVSGRRGLCHDPPEGGPVVAGYVHYFPLQNNAALRGTPTGAFFEGPTPGSHSTEIDGDGRFHLAVPPGPGVLLVRAQAGMPMMGEMMSWEESKGFHRLFPYVKLMTRAPDDGAPAGDRRNLPGFADPIPVENYHAYRVIDVPADAKTLDLTLTVPRAPSRVVHFVNPEGAPIKGVMVQGLVPSPMTTVLDGSEGEVLALERGKPRELIAVSTDGRYAAKTFVSTDDPVPKTIRFERAGFVTGRLLDAATGFPLVGYAAVNYWVPPGNERVRTDLDGRFLVRGLIPGRGTSIDFQGPVVAQRIPEFYRPESTRDLVLRSGEVRDLGEIRVNRTR